MREITSPIVGRTNVRSNYQHEKRRPRRRKLDPLPLRRRHQRRQRGRVARRRCQQVNEGEVAGCRRQVGHTKREEMTRMTRKWGKGLLYGSTKTVRTSTVTRQVSKKTKRSKSRSRFRNLRPNPRRKRRRVLYLRGEERGTRREGRWDGCYFVVFSLASTVDITACSLNG